MAEEIAQKEYDPKYWSWGKEATAPRFLFTMIRVRDPEASIRFYTEAFGMKVLERHDFEAARFSLIFLGFGGYESGALELTYNWDQSEPYSHGSGFGHIGLGVPDLEAAVAKLEELGANIPTRPKQMVAGAPKIAFAQDPDGYRLELIQTNRYT